MTPQKPCTICGKLMTRNTRESWQKWYDKKYCSRECHHKGMSTSETKICEHCGNKFKKPKNMHSAGWGKKKFCSRNCRYEAFKLSRDCRYEAFKLTRDSSVKRKYPGGRIWQCTCPGCGKKYTKYLFWSGRGNPRIYCDKCARTIEREDDGFLESAGVPRI